VPQEVEAQVVEVSEGEAERPMAEAEEEEDLEAEEVVEVVEENQYLTVLEWQNRKRGKNLAVGYKPVSQN